MNIYKVLVMIINKMIFNYIKISFILLHHIHLFKNSLYLFATKSNENKNKRRKRGQNATIPIVCTDFINQFRKSLFLYIPFYAYFIFQLFKSNFLSQFKIGF